MGLLQEFNCMWIYCDCIVCWVYIIKYVWFISLLLSEFYLIPEIFIRFLFDTNYIIHHPFLTNHEFSERYLYHNVFKNTIISSRDFTMFFHFRAWYSWHFSIIYVKKLWKFGYFQSHWFLPRGGMINYVELSCRMPRDQVHGIPWGCWGVPGQCWRWHGRIICTCPVGSHGITWWDTQWVL